MLNNGSEKKNKNNNKDQYGQERSSDTGQSEAKDYIIDAHPDVPENHQGLVRDVYVKPNTGGDEGATYNVVPFHRRKFIEMVGSRLHGTRLSKDSFECLKVRLEDALTDILQEVEIQFENYNKRLVEAGCQPVKRVPYCVLLACVDKFIKRGDFS